MHITGLVLSLCNEPYQAQATLEQIGTAGPFEISPSNGPVKAVVMETPDPHSAQKWHEWASRLPGVDCLEVVFVHWDQEETEVPHANS